MLAYLVIAAELQESDLLDEIAALAGVPVPTDVPAPSGQIGPDSVMPG
jgi:hypothetical protein